MRFFQNIIHRFLRENPDIPCQSDVAVVTDYSVRCFRTDCGDADIEPTRIPDELLEYADPDAESVREYWGVSPSATQSEPAESTIEGHIGIAIEGPSEMREVEEESATSDEETWWIG